MRNGIDFPHVLTSAEAAKYLRLPKATLLRMASAGEIPGREIEGEWRFSRAAIDDWLGKPDPTKKLLRQAGILAHDDTVPELLRVIYKAREER